MICLLNNIDRCITNERGKDGLLRLQCGNKLKNNKIRNECTRNKLEVASIEDKNEREPIKMAWACTIEVYYSTGQEKQQNYY